MLYVFFVLESVVFWSFKISFHSISIVSFDFGDFGSIKSVCAYACVDVALTYVHFNRWSVLCVCVCMYARAVLRWAELNWTECCVLRSSLSLSACVWIICVDATNVIRYGLSMLCFHFGWCGAVSVRMQSIPFCERGNRNSVVDVSSSPFPSSPLPSSLPCNSWTTEILCVWFLLVSLSVAVVCASTALRILNDLKIVCCSFDVCVGNFVFISFEVFFLSLSSMGCVLILNKPNQALNTINDYTLVFFYCFSLCTMRERIYEALCVFFLLFYILRISLLITDREFVRFLLLFEHKAKWKRSKKRSA